MAVDAALTDSASNQPIALPSSQEARKPAFKVKIGSIEIPIYGRAPGPYTVAWREHAGGPRLRAMRTKFAAAKKLASEKATALANGETAMLAMGQDDRASYNRARELLLPTGKSLELAASEYAEAIRVLRGTPLAEAVKYFLENRPAGVSSKTCAEIIDEMIQRKEAEGDVGERWLDTITGQLRGTARGKSRHTSFAATFKGPLHEVRAEQINKWLGTKGKSAQTRLNYRGALLLLVNYARGNGHLPASWKELTPELVPVPKLRQVAIKILTPEEIASLLTAAPDKLIPFIALTAFAGIRHAEMHAKRKRKEKQFLDWRDIDLANRNIYVPVGVAKKGEDRNVPISDNLAAWLKPYQRRNGLVFPHGDANKELLKAKQNAGLPSGRNQTRNTLRKSFISYRLAITKNIAQVAEEAGNSAAKIKSNYKHTVPRSEADRWFGIFPTSAEISQIPLFK